RTIRSARSYWLVAFYSQGAAKGRTDHGECCGSAEFAGHTDAWTANCRAHRKPHLVSRWLTHRSARGRRDSQTPRCRRLGLGNRKGGARRQAASLTPALLQIATVAVALRATRAFRAAKRLHYFLTTSAFSIIAMPPRSASLPFRVTFLPHKSAS